MKGEMTFWDHLEAFRWMMMRSIIALFVFMMLSFAFIPYIFDHIVMAPCEGDFFFYRWMCKLSSFTSLVPDFCNDAFLVKVVNIKLASQFFIHVTLSFWIALLFTFPYILYEIWKFVCPALYDNEKSGIRWAFCFGTVMFFIGCVVGYSVAFPLTLRFLYTYELSANITNQVSLDSYMNNFLIMVFVMGIMFELPLLSALLSKLGILHRSFFRKYRRYAIVVLLIVAAVITPSSDPFTLMAVFIPIYILWEVSALLVKKDKVTNED